MKPFSLPVHVCPCKFMFTRAGFCLPVPIHFTRVGLRLPVPVNVYPFLFLFNRAGSCLGVQIHVYPYRFLFTRVSSCSPVPVHVLGEKAKMRPLQHKLYFSGKNSATLQLLHEEFYLTYPPMPIVIYYFIQQSEPKQ